jgi:hypothetical protein
MPCLLPHERGPCVVQESHCGSAVRWQWRTPMGIQQGFGSLFPVGHGTQQPDAGSRISPQLPV